MAFLLMLMVPHKSMAQDGGYVSDQEFYDNLQNYGTWVQDDQYGNVWVPDVDGDFRPYATNGYWVQTDYGTTWVSDYPWGWATFHYGRWRYDDYYGWEWIPGHEWAPAWVNWRHGGGYYGWAPMQPGITISISIGGGGGYHVPDNYWVCAPQGYITSRNINRYYVQNNRTVNIIHNTTIINNTYVYNNQTYITGPRPQEIQRYTHRPVTVYKIDNASQPGAARVGRNQINIYRPAIKAQADARPARVVNATAYKQQNPNAAIGRRGAAVNTHVNAAKLAAVARTNNPGIVHVNPAPVATHPALPGGHRNVGPAAAPIQAPQNNNSAQRHAVTPAVMPPADHHNPTVRQPQQVQQQAQQVKQEGQQAKQQAQQQAKQQQQQAQQQTQQAKQQAQQAKQQAKQQAQQQAKQQQQQAQQQAKQQQQQAQQQAKQQAQQQAKQQQQQAQQQAKQQAQQQAKQQQQQAQQQARQQQQQAKQQAQQQAKQQQQQAQQQARQQQQQAKQQAQQRARQQQQQQKEQKQPPQGN